MKILACVGCAIVLVGIAFVVYYECFWHKSPWIDAGGHMHSVYSCKPYEVEDYVTIPHTYFDGRRTHTDYTYVPIGHHTEQDCRYW